MKRADSPELLVPESFHTYNISIDHFLPWSFVTHDQVWNLIPVLNQRINSAKSDRLPNLDQYLNDFASIHYKAFHLIEKLDKPKMLDDYVLLFNEELDAIHQFREEEFTGYLKRQIKPLYQIAANMGFEEGWRIKRNNITSE